MLRIGWNLNDLRALEDKIANCIETRAFDFYLVHYLMFVVKEIINIKISHYRINFFVISKKFQPYFSYYNVTIYLKWYINLHKG